MEERQQQPPVPSIANAQQQAANIAALQYMLLTGQNPSGSAQSQSLPGANATSPLATPFLLNAIANRNPVDALSLASNYLL